MKKYLLLCSALTIASSAYAEINCSVRPTCSDLGYTMSESDCAGRFTLKCPFDTSKLFCGGNTSGGDDVTEGDGQEKTCGDGGYLSAKPAADYICEEVPFGNKTCYTNCRSNIITCQVGSIVYSNYTCYEQTPDDKNGTVVPIGVVFDPSKNLAISLTDDAPGKPLISGNTTINMTQYSTWSAAIANTKSSYEKNIVGGTAENSNAVGYCANLKKGSHDVYGDDWFVPNIRDWMLIDVDAVNTSLSANGTSLSGRYWSVDNKEVNDAGNAFPWVYNSDGDSDSAIYDSSQKVRCAVRYYKDQACTGDDCASTGDTGGGSAVVGPKL